MFIVVEHKITNPDVFYGLLPKVAQAPAGVKALQFFPSTGKDRAVCLWESSSVESVKSFLEPLSASSARNTYYAVDHKQAIGLPALASAA